jgi:hypothetical protein
MPADVQAVNFLSSVGGHRPPLQWKTFRIHSAASPLRRRADAGYL